MTFEFKTAARIVFGNGKRNIVAKEAAALGKRAFVVTGRTPARAAELIEQLEKEQISVFPFSVPGEPTTDLVLEGIREARGSQCDLVIGFGGGSVIDAAKAIAAMITNRGDLFDYLEVIGLGKPLTVHPAPFIAIPTTAGTGAEVTRNAVLASREHRVKVSLRSPLMLPTLAVVDPELTRSMPPGVTASTGLDALTQVMEPYVTPRANPLTDSICREGMRRAARSLIRVYEDGNDVDAREDMAVTSLFGGMALANAGLGAVHGFAGPIGGMFSAPHGLICARLLPYVCETNIHALTRRHPESPSLARYHEVGQILTGKPTADAESAIEWVHDVCNRLDVPSLATFGVTRNDIPAIVEKSKRASSMKANPIQLTDEELSLILDRAIKS